MSLRFTTAYPHQLLSAFKKLIDDGHIMTWTYDADGDFTHSPDQWRGAAWFRPVFGIGGLEFYILPSQNVPISVIVYAVYHGRFAEAMLSHCDKLFADCSVTALANDPDLIAA